MPMAVTFVWWCLNSESVLLIWAIVIMYSKSLMSLWFGTLPRNGFLKSS